MAKQIWEKFYFKNLIKISTGQKIWLNDRDILEQIIIPYLLSSRQIKRVLDIGREQGLKRYNKFFAGCELWTIDKNPEHQQFGAKNHIIDDVVNIKNHFPDNYFDIVIMNGVFGWGLNKPQAIEAALRDIYKIIKKGGILVFGWNDMPGLRPVRLKNIKALKGFRPFYFIPLGGIKFTARNGRHTYNFYQKPIKRQLTYTMEERIQTYHQAIKVLSSCIRSLGFYASGLPGSYDAVWARDSMIISLGASLVGAHFKKAVAHSLKTLSRHQSAKGQIPNAVGDYNLERRSDVTFNTIDSSLWYIIGHHAYAQAYQDKTLLKKYKKHINKALTWLQYQDPNEDTLLVQQPTMDWMDAFPHKYGRTINTQALYYGVLRWLGDNKLAQHLKKVVNGEIEKYLALYDQQLGHYRPWIWKSHDGDREQGQWFDTLGNLLCIITGLATPKIARHILRHIEKRKINRPYPCKALYPPIKKSDKEWRSYFSQAASRTPYHYINAGIWPYIGGFYIAALVKMKQFKKAQQEFSLLTKANNQGQNQQKEFNEWLDGQKGQPKGSPYQGWSASMYIFALECLKRKKVPYF